MLDLKNISEKPLETAPKVELGRFERFNLQDNPFPAHAIIIKEAEDDRLNGNIFEMSIREEEYSLIIDNFVKTPQSDSNHLRLGYLMDTSYIGRGNGKSAFLINLQKEMNRNFCLDISDKVNKCVAIYLSPEPSGRTKTFAGFADLIFKTILDINIIDYCLATIRWEASKKLKPELDISSFSTTEEIIQKLSSVEWYQNNNLDLKEISSSIRKNEYLNTLHNSLLIVPSDSFMNTKFVNQEDFTTYYKNIKSKEKLVFLFSQLVDFFRAAHFNGSYIFIDDFERIPDFQSARQKRDFAVELRSCLFDGMYSNAKIGFYNFFLILHAGVPRLIQDAWSDSGLENRAPLFPKMPAKHIVKFNKLSVEHARLLLSIYLKKYRIEPDKEKNMLFPFTEQAVNKLAEASDLNAAKILSAACNILDKVAYETSEKIIDENLLSFYLNEDNKIEVKPNDLILDADVIDLHKKALGKE